MVLLGVGAMRFRRLAQTPEAAVSRAATACWPWLAPWEDRHSSTSDQNRQKTHSQAVNGAAGLMLLPYKAPPFLDEPRQSIHKTGPIVYSHRQKGQAGWQHPWGKGIHQSRTRSAFWNTWHARCMPFWQAPAAAQPSAPFHRRNVGYPQEKRFARLAILTKRLYLWLIIDRLI